MAARTIEPMELTVDPHEVRPLTQEDLLRMVEAGIIVEGEPVELLYGVLRTQRMKGLAHQRVLVELQTWLWEAGAHKRYEVLPEVSMRVPERTSMPEPDLIVAERGIEDPYPRTALLAVELSVTSLRVDTLLKPRLYAGAGVPDYWVVDIPGRNVRVMREPTERGYANVRTVRPGEALRPSHVAVPPLDLNALFERLDAAR